MTQFHPNHYIDLRTSAPIGSANQTITLSGQAVHRMQIDMSDGQVTNLTVGGRQYTEGAQYRIMPLKGWDTLIQFRPEDDQTPSGEPYRSQMQIILKGDAIVVAASHYADYQGKLSNQIFSFHRDGSYTIEALPPGASIQQQMPRESRQHESVIAVSSDGRWSMQEHGRQAASGERFAYAEPTPATGSTSVTVHSMTDQQDKMAGLSGGIDGFAGYDRNDPGNYNAAVIKRDANGQPLDFFYTRRDESLQLFSVPGGKVKIDCMSPDTHLGDESFFLESSAKFFPENGSSEDLDIQEALTLRSQTLREMGIQDVPRDQSGNLSCGLSPQVENQTGHKR